MPNRSSVSSDDDRYKFIPLGAGQAGKERKTMGDRLMIILPTLRSLKDEGGVQDMEFIPMNIGNSFIGRWLQVDPLADKNPGWNPYSYCLDNPLIYFDPDGMIEWPLTGNKAVNKKDYSDGAWGLSNTVVRTSTYLDTDRPPGASNPHIGIDYRAAEGTNFYSLGDGTVEEVGETSKGAKYITVGYEGGDKVRFLHISKVADGLEKGSLVYEGQILGETGKTGTKSPHLHVDAVDSKGNRIDPENKNYGTVTNKEFFGKYKEEYLKLRYSKTEKHKNPVNTKQGLKEMY